MGISLARVASDLRLRLASSDSRVGFLIGAGTSISAGLPGIEDLTSQVQKKLKAEEQGIFEEILGSIGAGGHIEDVLNRLRTIRDLLTGSPKQTYFGLKDSDSVDSLDQDICKSIADLVAAPPTPPSAPHTQFARWLRGGGPSRARPVELFTTNYDILLERALEDADVPFFDGFTGSVRPFFAPETVDAELEQLGEPPQLPPTWTRVWKLHGSVNWREHKSSSTGRSRVVRVSPVDPDIGGRLMVFPSREKYQDSRRTPFLILHDRLRRFVARGEVLLVCIGYSFGDQHINELLLQGLRINPRATVLVLDFGVLDHEKKPTCNPNIVPLAKEYRNFALYGPSGTILGGQEDTWEPPEAEGTETYCNHLGHFTLGDFKKFGAFLERLVTPGHQVMVEPEIKGAPNVAAAN